MTTFGELKAGRHQTTPYRWQGTNEISEYDQVTISQDHDQKVTKISLSTTDKNGHEINFLSPTFEFNSDEDISTLQHNSHKNTLLDGLYAVIAAGIGFAGLKGKLIRRFNAPIAVAGFAVAAVGAILTSYNGYMDSAKERLWSSLQRLASEQGSK